MSNHTLSCVLLNENARLPARQTRGSAGYDVSCCEHTVVPARGRAMIGTGLKVFLDSDSMYIRVAPRSGLATRGLFCVGGVVDVDYRGEIRVIMVNHTDQDFTFRVGDRIAQLIIERIATPRVVAVTEEEYASKACPSERGEGGFGSTG